MNMSIRLPVLAVSFFRFHVLIGINMEFSMYRNAVHFAGAYDCGP